MFGENIGDRDINTLTVAAIAQQYANIFKLAQYSAVGINIRSYSPQVNIQTVTQFINHQLLSDGAWQNYGTAPVRAALKLVYTLPGRELNLDIAAAGMQFGESEITPVILFSGNFSYNLTTTGSGGNLASLDRVLANWQADLSAYCELITDRFLSQTLTPDLAIPVAADIPQPTELEIPYAPNLYSLPTFT
jgi:hypothetical protein